MTMAKKVWDTLTTIFEASGPISIINTRREFFRTFAQEGENMEEHITAFSENFVRRCFFFFLAMRVVS